MPNEQKFISLNVLETDRQNRSRKAQDGTLTALMWSVSGIIIAACGGGGGGGAGFSVKKPGIDGNDLGQREDQKEPVTTPISPSTPTGQTQRSEPILGIENARDFATQEILSGTLRAIPIGEPGSGEVFVSGDNVLTYTPLTDLIAYAYEADPGKTIQDILNQIFGFQADGITSFITQSDILNTANYNFLAVETPDPEGGNQIAQAITKAAQAVMALRNSTGSELGSDTDKDGTTPNDDHQDLGADATLAEIQAQRLQKVTNLFAEFRDRFDDNTNGDDLDEDDNDVPLVRGTLKDAVDETQEKAEELNNPNHEDYGRPFAIGADETAPESIGEQLSGMEIIYDFSEQGSDYASIARLFNFVDPKGNTGSAQVEPVGGVYQTLTGVYIKATSNAHSDGNDIRLFYRVNDNLITQLNTDLLAEGESNPPENFRVLDANPYFYVSRERISDLVIVANGDLHSGLDEASLRKFIFDYYVWDGQDITFDNSEDSVDVVSTFSVTITPVNDAPHSLALGGARADGEYVVSHQGDILAANGQEVGRLSVMDLETTDIGDFTFSVGGTHGELFEVISELGFAPRLRMIEGAEQIKPGNKYFITITATDNGEGTEAPETTSIDVELVQGGIYITDRQSERATNNGGDLVDEEFNPNPHLPTEPSDERLTSAPPQELTASGSVTIAGFENPVQTASVNGETVYLNIGSRTLQEATPAVDEAHASVEFAGIVFTAETAGVAGNDISITLTLDTSLTPAGEGDPRTAAQVEFTEVNNVVAITYGEGAILADIIAELGSANTVNVALAEGRDGTEDVLDETGEVEADYASATLGGITFTAGTIGASGNAISVSITHDSNLDAAARTAAGVSVVESGNAITITYGMDATLGDILAQLGSLTLVSFALDGTEGTAATEVAATNLLDGEDAGGGQPAEPAAILIGGFTFTAVTAGAAGNAISVSFALDTGLEAAVAATAADVMVDASDPNAIAITYGDGTTLNDILTELTTAGVTSVTRALADGANGDDNAQEASGNLANGVDAFVPPPEDLTDGRDETPAVAAVIAEVNGVDLGALKIEGGLQDVDPDGIDGKREFYLLDDPANEDFRILEVGVDRVQHLVYIGTGITDVEMADIRYTIKIGVRINADHLPDNFDGMVDVDASGDLNDDNINTFHYQGGAISVASDNMVSVEAGTLYLNDGRTATFGDLTETVSENQLVIVENQGGNWVVGLVDLDATLTGTPGNDYVVLGRVELDQPAQQASRLVGDGGEILVSAELPIADVEDGNDIAVVFTPGAALSANGVITYDITYTATTTIADIARIIDDLIIAPVTGSTDDTRVSAIGGLPPAGYPSSLFGSNQFENDLVIEAANTIYVEFASGSTFSTTIRYERLDGSLRAIRVITYDPDNTDIGDLKSLNIPGLTFSTVTGTTDTTLLSDITVLPSSIQIANGVQIGNHLAVSPHPAGHTIVLEFTLGTDLGVITSPTTYTITYADDTTISDLVGLDIDDLGFSLVNGSGATATTLLSDIDGLPTTATQLEGGSKTTYVPNPNTGDAQTGDEPITYNLELSSNIEAGDFTITPTNINDNDPTIGIAVGANVLDRSADGLVSDPLIRYVVQFGENLLAGGTRAQGGDIVLTAIINDADNLESRDNTETLRLRLADADSNNDNALFSIDSEGNLRFNSGEVTHERPVGKVDGEYEVVLRLESTSSLEPTASATTVITERVMILVTNQPEAPSRIYVERSVSDGVVSHVLTTVDPILEIGGDQSSFTYTLVGRDLDDYGAIHNSLFSIGGENNREIVLNSEASDTLFAGDVYRIRVHVTDGDGLTHEEVIEFTLSGTLYIVKDGVNAYSGYTDSLGQGLLDEVPTGGTAASLNREIGTLEGGSRGAGFTTEYALASEDEATAQGLAATANNNVLFTLSNANVLSLNADQTTGDFEEAGRRTVLVKITNTETAIDQTTTHYELYTIRLNDVNDAPVLDAGAPIPITETDFNTEDEAADNIVILTHEMLAVSDADASDNKGGVPLGSFTFTLEGDATKGNIEVWNLTDNTWDEIASGDEFTLQQVREGHVRFVRDATEQHVISADGYAQADADPTQFTLTVSDGDANNDESASRTYTLQVTGVNDPLVFVANTGVSVMEGTSAANTTAITDAMLRFSDVDNSAEELVYTITAAPTKGWIEKEVLVAASRTIGGLTFTAEAVGPSGNSLGVQLTAATNGDTSTNVDIVVTSANVVFTYGSGARLSDIIEALDEHAENRISATLASGAEGSDDITATANVLRLTGGGVTWQIVRVGETFTQGDINSGDLRYHHDGSDDTNDYISDSPDFTDTHTDSFAVTVTDTLREGTLGEAHSGTAQVFDITITPVNDVPTQSRSVTSSLANNPGDRTTPYARDYAKNGRDYPLGDNRVVMNEGGVYVLTLADIGVYDPDHADDEVTYQIFNLDRMRLDLTDNGEDSSDLTMQSEFESTEFQAFVELDINTDSAQPPNWVALREQGEGTGQEFTLEDVRDGKVRVRHIESAEQFRDGSPEDLFFSYRFKDAATDDYSGNGVSLRIDVNYRNDAPTHLDLGFYKVSPDAQPGDNLNAEAGANGDPSYFRLNDEEVKDDALLTGYDLTTGYRDNHFFQIRRTEVGQFTQLRLRENIDASTLKLDGEAYYIQIQVRDSASSPAITETFDFILPVRRFDIDWDGSNADLVSGAPERVFDLDPNYDNNPHTDARETSSDRNGDVLTIGTFTIDMEGETPVLNDADSYAVITSADSTTGAQRVTVAANDLLDNISLTNPMTGAGNDNIWLVTATPNTNNPRLAALGNDESLLVTFTLVIEHAASHQDTDPLNSEHDLVGDEPEGLGSSGVREAGRRTADSDGVRRSFETFTIRFIGHEDEIAADTTTSTDSFTVYERNSDSQPATDSGVWNAPASDGVPGGLQQKINVGMPTAATIHTLQVKLMSEPDNEYRATDLVVNQGADNYNPNANPYEITDEYGALSIWADGRIDYTLRPTFADRVPLEGATQNFTLQAVYTLDSDETMMEFVPMNISIDVVGENDAPKIFLNYQEPEYISAVPVTVLESTDSRDGGSDRDHEGGGVNDSDIDIGEAQTARGNFRCSDVDTGAQLRLFSGVYEIGEVVVGSGVVLTFEGRYGTLTIEGITADANGRGLGGTWKYEADAKAEKIAAGASPQDIFELRVVDEHGETSGTIDLVVTVQGSNDKPFQLSRDFNEGSYDGTIIESGYRSNPEHNFLVSGDPNENSANIHPPRLTDDDPLPNREARKVENVRDGDTDNDVDGNPEVRGTLDVEDVDVIGSDGRLIPLADRDQHSFVIESQEDNVVDDPYDGVRDAHRQIQEFHKFGGDQQDAARGAYTEHEGTYGTLRVHKYTGDWVYILDNFDSDTAGIDEGDTPTDEFRILITDQHGAQSVDLLTITVNGSEDAPILGIEDAVNRLDIRIGERGGRLNTLSGSAVQGVGENGDTASGQFTYHDDDGDDTGFTSSSTGGGGRLQGRADPDGGGAWTTANGTTYRGTYGDLEVQGDGSWEYTLRNEDRNTQALNDGDRAYDSFNFRILDNNVALASNILTLKIGIIGANDAPELRDVTFTDDGRVTEAGTQQDGTVITAADREARGTMITHDVDSADHLTHDEFEKRLKVVVAQEESQLTPGLPSPRGGDADPQTGRRTPQILEVDGETVIQGTTSPDTIGISGREDIYEVLSSYGVFVFNLTANNIFDANNNPVDGLLTWRFDLREGAADGLGEGQSVTESIFVRLYDGNNATERNVLSTVSDVEEIRVTIRGSNDGPTVTQKETIQDVNGEVTENNDLTDNGRLTFGDIDHNNPNQELIIEISSLEDFSHADATVTRLLSEHDVDNEWSFFGGEVTSNADSIGFDPGDSGTTFLAGTLGTFKFSRNNGDGATNDDEGELIWTYELNDNDIVNQLSYRETVTDSVWVRISDGDGGVSTPQRVSVTITGVNDAPILQEHTGGDTILRETGSNQAGATLTIGDDIAGGTMAITDHDGDDVIGSRDLHNGLKVLVTSIGFGAPLDEAAPDVDGEEIIQVFKESDSGNPVTFSYATEYGVFLFHIDEDDNLAWRFQIDDEAADSIGINQSEVDSVWVRVYDQHGGVSARQHLSVNIHGSNDGPTIEVGQNEDHRDETGPDRIVAVGEVTQGSAPSDRGVLKFGDDDANNHNVDLTIVVGNNLNDVSGFMGLAGPTVTIGSLAEGVHGTGGTNTANPDYMLKTYEAGELGVFNFERHDSTGELIWTYRLHEDSDVVKGLADGETVTDRIWVQVIDTSGLDAGKDLSDLADEPWLRSQVIRSQVQEIEVTITGGNDLPEVSESSGDSFQTSELSDENEERYYFGTITYGDPDRDHDLTELIIEVARNEAFEAEVVEVMAGATEFIDFDGSGGTTSPYRPDRGDPEPAQPPITFGGGELGYFNFWRQTNEDGEETGKLEWEYIIDPKNYALADRLSYRERIEESVWVRISDARGSDEYEWQKLTAVITGADDAPFVSVEGGDKNRGLVVATAGTQGSGTFSFGDPDNQDANTELTIYVSREPQWDAVNPDEQEELLTDMSIETFLGETQVTTNQEGYGNRFGSFRLERDNDTGKIHWTYTVADAAISDLPQVLSGEQVIFSRIWFQVVQGDGAAAVKSEIRELEITISGTNDVPTLEGDDAGEILENSKTSDSGTLTYGDPDAFDLNTLLTITIGRNENFSGTTKQIGTGDSAFGGSGGLSNMNDGADNNNDDNFPAKSYVSGELGIFTFDRDESQGQLTWTYTLHDTDVVDALAGGEVVTDSIWVKVNDRTGGESEDLRVTVTIRGDNDAPFVEERAGDIVNAQLVEDADSRFYLGLVSFGDPDRNHPNENLTIRVSSLETFPNTDSTTTIDTTPPNNQQAYQISGSGGNALDTNGAVIEERPGIPWHFGGGEIGSFYVTRDNVSGKISWRYYIEDQDLVNTLGEGQRVVDSIWVQITDGGVGDDESTQLASQKQKITVTIVGRGDDAIIGVQAGDDNLGQVIENSKLVDGGYITYLTIDGGPGGSANITVSRNERGDGAVPVESGTPLELFFGTATNPNGVRSTNGTYGSFTFSHDGSGRLRWDYQLKNNDAVNALPEGVIIYDRVWVVVDNDVQNAQLIEVAIQGVNDAPTAPRSFPSQTVPQGGKVIQIGGFRDLDRDSITYTGTISSITDNPDPNNPPRTHKIGQGTLTWINVSAAGDTASDGSSTAVLVVTGTTQREVGTYMVTITASDGRGGMASVQFALEVQDTENDSLAVYTIDTPPGVAVPVTGTLLTGRLVRPDTDVNIRGEGVLNPNYQWLRNGVEIRGATALTYTVVAEDIGRLIQLRVRYEDGSGRREETKTDIVQPGNTGPALEVSALSIDLGQEGAELVFTVIDADSSPRDFEFRILGDPQNRFDVFNTGTLDAPKWVLGLVPGQTYQSTDPDNESLTLVVTVSDGELHSNEVSFTVRPALPTVIPSIPTVPDVPDPGIREPDGVVDLPSGGGGGEGPIFLETETAYVPILFPGTGNFKTIGARYEVSHKGAQSPGNSPLQVMRWFVPEGELYAQSDLNIHLFSVYDGDYIDGVTNPRDISANYRVAQGPNLNEFWLELIPGTRINSLETKSSFVSVVLWDKPALISHGIEFIPNSNYWNGGATIEYRLDPLAPIPEGLNPDHEVYQDVIGHEYDRSTRTYTIITNREVTREVFIQYWNDPEVWGIDPDNGQGNFFFTAALAPWSDRSNDTAGNYDQFNTRDSATLVDGRTLVIPETALTDETVSTSFSITTWQSPPSGVREAALDPIHGILFQGVYPTGFGDIDGIRYIFNADLGQAINSTTAAPIIDGEDTLTGVTIRSGQQLTIQQLINFWNTTTVQVRDIDGITAARADGQPAPDDPTEDRVIITSGSARRGELIIKFAEHYPETGPHRRYHEDEEEVLLIPRREYQPSIVDLPGSDIETPFILDGAHALLYTVGRNKNGTDFWNLEVNQGGSDGGANTSTNGAKTNRTIGFITVRDSDFDDDATTLFAGVIGGESKRPQVEEFRNNFTFKILEGNNYADYVAAREAIVNDVGLPVPNVSGISNRFEVVLHDPSNLSNNRDPDLQYEVWLKEDVELNAGGQGDSPATLFTIYVEDAYGLGYISKISMGPAADDSTGGGINESGVDALNIVRPDFPTNDLTVRIAHVFFDPNDGNRGKILPSFYIPGQNYDMLTGSDSNGNRQEGTPDGGVYNYNNNRQSVPVSGTNYDNEAFNPVEARDRAIGIVHLTGSSALDDNGNLHRDFTFRVYEQVLDSSQIRALVDGGNMGSDNFEVRFYQGQYELILKKGATISINRHLDLTVEATRLDENLPGGGVQATYNYNNVIVESSLVSSPRAFIHQRVDPNNDKNLLYENTYGDRDGGSNYRGVDGNSRGGFDPDDQDSSNDATDVQQLLEAVNRYIVDYTRSDHITFDIKSALSVNNVGVKFDGDNVYRDDNLQMLIVSELLTHNTGRLNAQNLPVKAQLSATYYEYGSSHNGEYFGQYDNEILALPLETYARRIAILEIDGAGAETLSDGVNSRFAVDTGGIAADSFRVHNLANHALNLFDFDNDNTLYDSLDVRWYDGDGDGQGQWELWALPGANIQSTNAHDGGADLNKFKVAITFEIDGELHYDFINFNLLYRNLYYGGNDKYANEEDNLRGVHSGGTVNYIGLGYLADTAPRRVYNTNSPDAETYQEIIDDYLGYGTDQNGNRIFDSAESNLRPYEDAAGRNGNAYMKVTPFYMTSFTDVTRHEDDRPGIGVTHQITSTSDRKTATPLGSFASGNNYGSDLGVSYEERFKVARIDFVGMSQDYLEHFEFTLSNPLPSGLAAIGGDYGSGAGYNTHGNLGIYNLANYLGTEATRRATEKMHVVTVRDGNDKITHFEIRLNPHFYDLAPAVANSVNLENEFRAEIVKQMARDAGQAVPTGQALITARDALTAEQATDFLINRANTQEAAYQAAVARGETPALPSYRDGSPGTTYIDRDNIYQPAHLVHSDTFDLAIRALNDGGENNFSNPEINFFYAERYYLERYSTQGLNNGDPYNPMTTVGAAKNPEAHRLYKNPDYRILDNDDPADDTLVLYQLPDIDLI